ARPAAAARIRAAAGAYKLPPPALLQEPALGERVDEDELREMADALTNKCDEFDVRGRVTQINPGPVVTTYEYKPEAGIKYNRITALNDDLCLALEAESIYIERIPGKSTVGIEVPNRRRETIFLREVVESSEFHASDSPLTIALGKDIAGHIITADLAAMPHLLIAGSTGSGKSVALNSVIVSLLYKSTPDEVRLILVDPKRLELGLYDGIPHLYTPIITEPKLAANALRNATREMERRLKLLAARGVRNIAQFNRLFEKEAPGLFDQLENDADNRPLPYIVIVIDELADLMIVDANNVEESITRLAQMARAVGIHLILATQRPSVDVITGLIKANFPARISFRVATKVDSRTILDAQGAESLLGKGDMLFLPPGTSRLHRVHGAFVTEREITSVVEFWARQATPEFDETFLKPPAEEVNEAAEAGNGGESGEGGNDPLFEDAVRVVLEYGKASTSLLQRRLRIGYGRAAHLIDLMYNDGIVGPADGPKPRELLKRPDWLAEVDEALR
ncbi:MAG: DNA translocase FtsK, partial [Terriglobales bacterium]